MKEVAPQMASPSVFDRAAELFGVLATPIRLRIIGALCSGEKNVSNLLNDINVSQPNMSRHLNVLYRTGVVTKRRSGVQVFYRISDDSVALVCKAVCSQVELEVKMGCKLHGGDPAACALNK